MLPFDAIIFDHDGTLVDTEGPDYEACRILCQELDIELSKEIWAHHVVGRVEGYQALHRRLIQPTHPHLSFPTMKQRLRQLWPITLQQTQLMPGVKPLLSALAQAGYPLAVATAADRAWVNRWLTHFELTDYFQAVACSDDITHNKPAPDVYLHAARLLGVKPRRCLVFEDSLVGVEAAAAAGMRVVAVPSPITRSLDFSAAHALITDLNDVSPVWITALANNGNRRVQ